MIVGVFQWLTCSREEWLVMGFDSLRLGRMNGMNDASDILEL